MKRNYKITPQEYESLVLSQNYKCAICDKRPKRLVIDHDHNTGTIRGLLCFDCNTGLGKFGDVISGLEKAVKYLKNQRVISV